MFAILRFPPLLLTHLVSQAWRLLTRFLPIKNLQRICFKVLVFGKLRSKIVDLIEALKGKLSKTQADKIRIALDNFLNLNEKIAKIETLIDGKSKPYQPIIDLLCTVPGIKKNAAVAIIAEISTDMSKFYSSNHLCSWAGVCPQNNQSAGKKKPARSKSGNSYLKSMLVQCANAAVKKLVPGFLANLSLLRLEGATIKPLLLSAEPYLHLFIILFKRNRSSRNPLKQNLFPNLKNQNLLPDSNL